MSEALIPFLDRTDLRPKGVTPKQWRLAALYPRCETAYEACIRAGYKPSVATGVAKRTYDTVGVRRALATQESRQADSARGLHGIATEALTLGKKGLKDLDTRDLLAFGVNATKVAHEIGEDIEQRGEGSRWIYRLRRAALLMAALTAQRLALPPPLLEAANQRHALRQLRRAGSY